MDATPSVSLPPDAESGIPRQPPQPLQIGGRSFVWGTRTFVMGIINVTPDSFSGDGLLASNPDPVAAAVAQARRMAAEGADMLDIGGRVDPAGTCRTSRQRGAGARHPGDAGSASRALPDMPLSIDTTSAEVAEAALEAGARLFNDVWGTAADADAAGARRGARRAHRPDAQP